MKKIIALLLALVMVLGCFVGCASDDDSKKSDKDSAEKVENVENVNKELLASQELVADTMLLTEELSKGTKFEISANVIITPSAEFPVDAEIATYLETIFTKNSDGSYVAAITLSGTADSNGAVVVIKLGDKVISECIATSDSKVYINVKTIWEFVFDIIGKDIPWNNTDEYIEVTDLLANILGIEGDIPDVGALIEAIEIPEDLPEEYMTMIEELLSNSEIAEEFDYMTEMVTNIAPTVLANPELSKFINDILVVLADSEILVVTENSFSTLINAESIKKSTTALTSLLETKGDTAIQGVVDILVSLGMIEESQKEVLSQITVDALKSQIEAEISFEELETKFDEVLALLGESYIKADYELNESSILIKEEICIDLLAANQGQIDESLPISKCAAGFSFSLSAEAVDAVTAPTNVIDASELMALFSVFDMIM